MTKWKCTNCYSVLGRIDPKTEELCIKRKDLYVYVNQGTNGSVSTICTKCGKKNIML